MPKLPLISGSWGITTRRSLQPLREQAYQTIKSAIILQRWPVGAPLSEDQLAEELRVSRTPVREALQALAREEFVQVLPGRGTFVAGLSPDDLREIFEYREALETQTVRLATERAAAADLRELQEIAALSPDLSIGADEVRYAGGDYKAALARVEEFHRTGREFHGCVARIAGNVRIQEALSNLLCLTIPARLQYALGFPPGRDPQAEHQQIAEAICTGDAEMAERLMRTHIRSTYESLPSRIPSSRTEAQIMAGG